MRTRVGSSALPASGAIGGIQPVIGKLREKKRHLLLGSRLAPSRPPGLKASGERLLLASVPSLV